MYNEEAGAQRCVREVCKVLQCELPGSRLFAVNDGSRDRTGEVLSQMKGADPTLPLSLVLLGENQGYGAAVIEGARAADLEGYEFALFMDSDLTNPPCLIKTFRDKAAEGECDLIKASRYIPGGGMRGVPWNRQCVTIAGNKIASFLFGMGVRDCTNGFRAVRLSLLRGVRFQERGFASIVEELYHLKRRGARVAEIPYILTARGQGQGESKFHYTPGLLCRYLKYALKAAIIKFDKVPC